MSEKKEIEEIQMPGFEEDTRLPFEPAGRDPVEWIYDHRKGILITAAIYLLLGIGIVTARFSLQSDDAQSAIYIDMKQLEQLAAEKERLEQQVRELQELREMEGYEENLRNIASNADGELNPDLRDGHGTNASEIYDEARAMEERLNASREAYERGLQAAENIRNDRPQQAGDQARPGRVEGPVSISYSLADRHATYLYRPTYQCLGGGVITVNITVNRNGQVTEASVAAGSSADACLRDFAVRAAKASTFNVDGTADNRQSGTITYKFVAQ